MKLELRKLLQMLGVLQPDPVFSIGGSDVLPQPLAPAQEQALLRELAAGSESATPGSSLAAACQSSTKTGSFVMGSLSAFPVSTSARSVISRSSSRSVSCSNERAECCAQAEKKSRQTATHNAPMAHSASALTG